jgi:molybdopterin-guanine dinucleotide biosynthesis protein A
MAEVAGIVLAGGKSRRMGRDKRFLEVDGQRLVDRTAATLQGLFRETIIVAAEPEPMLEELNLRIVCDRIPGAGSLGGLYTGLMEVHAPRACVVACDMPFLSPALLEWMARRNPEADIVMAKLATGLQPMHAVYGKRCLAEIDTMLQAGELKAQRLVQRPGLAVSVIEESELRPLDADLLSFLNLNTPADLELARKLVSRRNRHA